MTRELTTTGGDLQQGDALADFGTFLRLHVADGDASERTIAAYKSHAGAYVAWCKEQEIDPARAQENDIVEYRHHLAGEYARSTVAVKLAAVRRLYDAILWRGLRTDNPAAGLKAPKNKTAAHERIRYISLGGLRRLLNAPRGHKAMAIRDRAMLALMGCHGLRVSEVADLEIGDLDLEADQARITGKGDKIRTINLVPSTKEALRLWLATHDQVASDTPALFVSLDHRTAGRPISARSIRRRVDHYLEITDLKDEGISCHSLRHSAATWARAGGATIDALADMLGHASTDTTRVYARIVDGIKENPARYLEAMLEDA